jgi:ribosomal protein S12 methylthiotransferase
VHLRDAGAAQAGDILQVRVEDADEHDLFGLPVST